MKYFILHIILLFISVGIKAQNALILKDNPYIVLNGGTVGTPIYIIVNQSNANGIITQGSGGNIISENEYNYVKWNISSTAGIFTIPFSTGVIGGTEQKIPLTMQTTIAGIGAGDFLFSTYETDNNNLPWASGVTHFRSASGSLDNKDWVVDRFWIIDAENYTTKPAAQLSFGFNDNTTEVGTPNLITIANLGAQRFNPAPQNLWEGTTGGSGIWGTVSGSAGSRKVSGVNVLATEFYRAWTLADYSHPLPLSLTYFKGECKNSSINLSWEVSNNEVATYLVQKSLDGVNFSTIGTTNSFNSETSFKFVDRNPYIEKSYYRLILEKETNDLHSETIVVKSCDKNTTSFVYSPLNNSTIYIEISAEQPASKHQFLLVDISGKIVQQQDLYSTNKGNNQFMIDASGLASGIYNVVLIDQYGIKKTTKLIL